MRRSREFPSELADRIYLTLDGGNGNLRKLKEADRRYHDALKAGLGELAPFLMGVHEAE